MGHTLHIIARKFFFCTFLISSVCSKLTIVDYITLKTKFATVIGTHETVVTTSINSKGVYSKDAISYLRFILPYAEAPVGPMRWKDTVLKQSFPEYMVFDATTERPPCPQWVSKNGTSILLGDEDCLYASIFVPLQALNNTMSPLKIMVFFHGGGFIVNSNRNTLPIPLLTQKNSIIIMFNYRISIFGYLSTGTSVLPGNYAFLDQITMLKWIQMYGRDFGGDPNEVTLFGSSIGSVSIHYLLLSKLSVGLFHKVIMESGSAFCERSLVPNPQDISRKLGGLVGCSSLPSQQLFVACLQSKSTVELMMAAKHLTTQWVLPSVLGPVIDKMSRPPEYQFLPDFPEEMKIINKVPVIVGITTEEGLTAFVKLFKNYNMKQLHDLRFIQSFILPHHLNLIMRARKQPPQRQAFIEMLSKEVMLHYWEDFLKDPIVALVGILGDLWINSCNRKTLEHLCMNSVPSVYAYLFSHHDAEISPSEISTQIDELQKLQINHPILDKGVAHTEEILYLLEDEKAVHDGTAHFLRNKQMSDILSNIWTNFAASSLNPATGAVLSYGWPIWNPVCYTSGNYSLYDSDHPLYEISLDNHRTFRNYRLKEAQFWRKIHEDVS